MSTSREGSDVSNSACGDHTTYDCLNQASSEACERCARGSGVSSLLAASVVVGLANSSCLLGMAAAAATVLVVGVVVMGRYSLFPPCLPFCFLSAPSVYLSMFPPVIPSVFPSVASCLAFRCPQCPLCPQCPCPQCVQARLVALR